MKKITLLIGLLVSFGISNAQKCDLSKSSIKIGLGYGQAEIGSDDVGSTPLMGSIYSIGYQRDIWKDKLRLNPNLSFGTFETINMTDVPSHFFSSISVQSNLFYDVVRYKTVSLVLGTGLLFNNSKGMVGTREFVDSELFPAITESKDVNVSNFGGYFGAGIRFSSSEKRTAFNLLPFNTNIGTNGLLEFSAKLELDVKF